MQRVAYEVSGRNTYSKDRHYIDSFDDLEKAQLYIAPERHNVLKNGYDEFEIDVVIWNDRDEFEDDDDYVKEDDQWFADDINEMWEQGYAPIIVGNTVTGWQRRSGLNEDEDNPGDPLI